MLGGPVVETLLTDGCGVRILSREPGKAVPKFGSDVEYYQADVQDIASLKNAFSGCDTVHVNLSTDPGADTEAVMWHGLRNVREAAESRNLRLISLVAGDWEPDVNHAMPRRAAFSKGMLALEESMIPTIVWQATWFFESLEYFVLEDRAMMIGLQPLDWHFIAAADYANWVSKAMKMEWQGHHRFTVQGPEPMKMLDALKKYCAVTHPGLPVEQRTIGGVKEFARQNPQHGWLGGFADFMAYFETYGEMGNPAETYRRFGKPEWTLDKWLATGIKR